MKSRSIKTINVLAACGAVLAALTLPVFLTPKSDTMQQRKSPGLSGPKPKRKATKLSPRQVGAIKKKRATFSERPKIDTATDDYTCTKADLYEKLHELLGKEKCDKLVLKAPGVIYFDETPTLSESLKQQLERVFNRNTRSKPPAIQAYLDYERNQFITKAEAEALSCGEIVFDLTSEETPENMEISDAELQCILAEPAQVHLEEQKLDISVDILDQHQFITSDQLFIEKFKISELVEFREVVRNINMVRENSNYYLESKIYGSAGQNVCEVVKEAINKHSLAVSYGLAGLKVMDRLHEYSAKKLKLHGYGFYDALQELLGQLSVETLCASVKMEVTAADESLTCRQYCLLNLRYKASFAFLNAIYSQYLEPQIVE